MVCFAGESGAVVNGKVNTPWEECANNTELYHVIASARSADSGPDPLDLKLKCVFTCGISDTDAGHKLRR
jgi:hypothetical protein